MEIEDLGYLEAALDARGLGFAYVDAESLTDDLPEPEALIVLGGPMGVYERDAYPFLNREIELIRRQLTARRPVLGICLGAQLLAAAADAAVYPGTRGKEIGWAEVSLTAAGRSDPLWGDFPARFLTFHWHGDSFDLPTGGDLLASSDRYPQCFRLGRYAYGIQFHPEVVPERLDSWIRAYHLELERERLSSQEVLAAPHAGTHRELAGRFGANIARWLLGACRDSAGARKRSMTSPAAPPLE